MSEGKIKLVVLCLLAFFVTATFTQQKEKTPFPHLTGNYFGQNEPGGEAALFAPGLISLEGRYEFAPSFSPAGDELLFTVQVPEKPACVYYTKIENGRWTEPKPVSLSKGAKKEEMEAFFSWDGRHIFFAPYDEGLDVRIWKVDIREDGWHDPQPLKGRISDESAFFPTCSKKGTLYYSNITQRKIYKAWLDNGVVKESKDAGLDFGGHGFIAPDESFILVDSIQDNGYGKQDIYVAFRNKNGSWSKPVNLGNEVNTEYSETCPALSSDGKHLFFSRYNEPGEISNFYWIDSRVIEEARRSFDSERENHILNGPFLGQKPPGKIPVKFPFDFMPDGYRLHSAPAFMPGGDEVYFSAMDFSIRFSERIFFMKIIDGIWTSPQVAPFSGNTFDGSPSISRDGKYLVFSSARKPEEGGMNETGERNIWYVERKREDWSSPRPLNFQTPEWENGSDISELGNLFFDSKDIYKIKFPPEKSDKAEKLGNAINSSFTELHPCIAPDERFIVFYSSRPQHHGSEGGDLYISFRNNDGTWKQAVNLGEQFNKGHLSTSFPRLSPDGKYFFFLKLVSIPWQTEVFWVSVEALDDLNR